MKKNKISVRLMGRDYSLLTDQTPQKVQTVARYVDRKMREMAITARVPDGALPVQTALTLGDELFNAQQENMPLKRELAQMEQKLCRQTAQDGQES